MFEWSHSLILKKNLFKTSFITSLVVHFILFTSIFTANISGRQYISSDDIDISQIDVDLSQIPPELLGGDQDPAKIETVEWIEGKNKKARKEDPVTEEESVNAVSGKTEDGEGYMFAVHGDRPPVPIIRFNVNDFYPAEAKRAQINEKTVLVNVQIDENGSLNSIKIASTPAGYGFDEAAIKILKLARFRPGYKEGHPVKMNHTMSFKFKLE